MQHVGIFHLILHTLLRYSYLYFYIYYYNLLKRINYLLRINNQCNFLYNLKFLFLGHMLDYRIQKMDNMCIHVGYPDLSFRMYILLIQRCKNQKYQFLCFALFQKTTLFCQGFDKHQDL